ncbi:hypothetical protein D9M71_286360 [compost metagenome]
MQLDLDQHVAAQFGTEGTSTVQQVQPLRVGATELHPLRHIEALKHRQAGCAQHGAIHLTAEMKGVVALDAAGQLGHRGDIDHQPLAMLHIHEQHRMWLSRLRREQQRGAARLTEPFEQGQALTGVVYPGRCIDLLFHPSPFWSTAQRCITALYRPIWKRTLESGHISPPPDGAQNRLKFNLGLPILCGAVHNLQSTR